MRIITGTARGRKIKEPSNAKIRPTTGLVKEAIFNIIQFDIEGRRVLDLFAGTGQLGLETLSRGAASCDFVDQSKEAVMLVKENLKQTELLGGRVHQSEALSFISRGEKYDLIFIDPPYDGVNIDKVIEKIVQVDILQKNGIMVCETDFDVAMPEGTEFYQKGREYRYGKLKLTLYSRL